MENMFQSVDNVSWNCSQARDTKKVALFTGAVRCESSYVMFFNSFLVTILNSVVETI